MVRLVGGYRSVRPANFGGAIPLKWCGVRLICLGIPGSSGDFGDELIRRPLARLQPTGGQIPHGVAELQEVGLWQRELLDQLAHAAPGRAGEVPWSSGRSAAAGAADPPPRGGRGQRSPLATRRLRGCYEGLRSLHARAGAASARRLGQSSLGPQTRAWGHTRRRCYGAA